MEEHSVFVALALGASIKNRALLKPLPAPADRTGGGRCVPG